MNTPKHTPGPFKAVQVYVENAPCVWAVQRKNIREQLWGKSLLATYIDNEADARLFAAAPDMLEALVLAHRMLLQTDWRHEDAAMNDIVAAIAKAEGHAQ